MGSHMKTTIEISDSLLAQARKLAAREETTVRALVEQGLRQVVAQYKVRGTAFHLRDASFKGEGLNAQASGASWEELRAQIYQGRGG